MSTPDPNIVQKLVQATPTDHLQAMLTRLNRTRRKWLDCFHVNGTPYVTTRRWARDAVKAELAARAAA